jgi:hypothetical protein
MSGPIIRKYGFPNFEKIFGDRELKHGTDAQAPTPSPISPTDAAPKPSEPTEPAKVEPVPPKP